MEPIFILFLSIATVLIIAIGFFGFHLFKLKRRISFLLEGKKTKNLEDVILNQIQKTKKQEADIADLFEKIKKLESISEKTFQKIAVVRFNPFQGMGGNQSFVIALLDSQNNGFVISSLFIQEGNRVYAKSIKNGQSDHPLSDEERKALEKAISQK